MKNILRNSKTFIFLFILCALNLSISSKCYGSVSLRERLVKGENGDYIVTLENKTYSLIVIKDISKDKVLTLSEISIPKNLINLKKTSWREWIRKNAPQSTSYNIYKIDLTNSNVLKCYSVTKKSFFNCNDQDIFFTKLLNLPLHRLADEKRKKIGAPPLDNSLDTRALWNPPQTIDGIRQKKPSYIVYQTSWPKDGSDLSGKVIDLYFEKNNFIPFPYWIQVSNGNIEIMLKIIDSGKNMICNSKMEIPK